MWFWSVSLADQLSGQFLICFGWPKENCPVSETGQFFLSTLLKIGHSLIPRLDKKNQESGQSQLYDLKQVREDLEDLFHHKPARLHEIMEKIRIVNEKLCEKLARARRLIYCVENCCDVCYPDVGVLFE